MTCKICRDIGCHECLQQREDQNQIVPPVAAMSFDGLIARVVRNDEQEWKERFFQRHQSSEVM